MSVAKRMAQKRRELYKKYQVDSDNSLIYEMTDRIAELEQRVSISRECVAYCLVLCEKTYEKLSIVSTDESYMKALAFVIAELSRALEAANE